MKINKFQLTLAACALLVMTTVNAFAQVGRIEGDVIKRGTTEPIPNAVVQIVRTDIKGNYEVKSDKKGHFLHAGVPYVGTYTVLVSAEACEPFYAAGIRPTGEPMKIELGPGDGRKLTIDELKKAQAAAPAGGAGAGKQMSAAEAKKAAEEYEKKRAEVEKQNEKTKVDFENMKKSFDAGLVKMNAKDYNGAITDFNEATKFDADQYAIWANLALSLYNRGVTNLNDSIKDPSKRDPAKQDFTDSINAISKALPLAEKNLTDPAKSAEAKKQKATAIKIKADSEGLLAMRFNQADMIEAAVKDYKEAADLNELPADKTRLQLAGAKVLFESGKAEESVAAYSAILATDPENIEATYQLGLAYANVGKFQESANTLQKFVDKAPANDPRAAEAKAVIEHLVVGNNLKPPKAEPARKSVAAPAKRKG